MNLHSSVQLPSAQISCRSYIFCDGRGSTVAQAWKLVEIRFVEVLVAISAKYG